MRGKPRRLSGAVRLPAGPVGLDRPALVLRAAARRIRADHLGAGAADRRADAGRARARRRASRSQTGQVYVSQQVFGSTPVLIGVRPFGQAIANVGQATGLFGSQVGGGGDGNRHWPTHVRPLHAPLASQTQLLSVASQAQAAPGGARHPGRRIGSSAYPCRCRRGRTPTPCTATLHTWPVGQSVFDLAAGLRDVGDADAVAARSAGTRAPPSRSCRPRSAGSGRLARRWCRRRRWCRAGPAADRTWSTSHWRAPDLPVVVIGGSRHADRSHFWSAPQLESSLQMPRAGLQ